MIEIIPRIYELRLPIPHNALGFTNVYLLRGNDGNLLIDTGWDSDDTFQSLKDQLSEIGVDPKDISQIVVTHGHRDHYGLVTRLKALAHPRIYLHYLEEDNIITRYNHVEETIRQTMQRLHNNGVPDIEVGTIRLTAAQRRWLTESASPDVSLRGGETISANGFNLQVIWTPGHSIGHVCLYEPAHKILFSGDHVLPGITPNISLQNHSGPNPLGDFIKSLNKVKQLDATIVLPAHEHPFTNLQKRVDEIINHHEHRNVEIMEALKSGQRTGYQVAEKVTWMPETGGVNFHNLALWDQRTAVLETLAHLESLHADGLVKKATKDDIIYYQRT